MANRLVVAAVALVVGIGLYAGLLFVDAQLSGPDGVAPDGEVVAGTTTLYLDRVGRPTVVGEVQNGRRGPVDVRVSVEFFEDGASVGTASGSTLVPTVAGRGAAPFVVRLPNRSAQPDDYAVSVAADADATRPYDRLAVDASVADRSQEQLIVAGTVTNDGGRAVSAHVVATFYDANGTVVGARAVRPSPAVLEPGAEGEFTVRFRTLGDLPSLAGDAESYELTAYGLPPESG